MSTACSSVHSNDALDEQIKPYKPSLSVHDGLVFNSNTKTGDYTISKRAATIIKLPRDDFIVNGFVRHEFNRTMPTALLKMIRDFQAQFQVLKLSRAERHRLSSWINGNAEYPAYHRAGVFRISALDRYNMYLTVYFHRAVNHPEDGRSQIYVYFYVGANGIAQISGRFGISLGAATRKMQVRYLSKYDANKDPWGDGQMITRRRIQEFHGQYIWTFYHDVTGIETAQGHVSCIEPMKSMLQQNKFCFYWKPSSKDLAKFLRWHRNDFYQKSGPCHKSIFTANGWQLIFGKKGHKNHGLLKQVIFVSFIPPFILFGQRQYRSIILTRTNGQWNDTKLNFVFSEHHGFYMPRRLDARDRTFAVQFKLYYYKY